MTVKITLKKRFNKNAATCFYTEHAKKRHLQDHPGRRDHGNGL